MNYNLSDSSGTDDDLPPTHQNRYGRNVHVADNERSAVPDSHTRMHNNDMETEIHDIERNAYYHVIRAFRAQSDALSWDKEDLIIELRKELRISHEDHRELLSSVKNDDTIQRIREWSGANGLQAGEQRSFQSVHDSITSPTPSASRKKMKTGPTPGSSSVGPPHPALHPPMQSPLRSLKRGPPIGGRSTQPDMSPRDIRWEGEDPGIFQRGGRPGRGHGLKKSSNRGGASGSAGRGRGTFKGQTKKDLSLPQNGIAGEGSADVELLHTDTLIKEVEKIFSSSQPGTVEVEKAKKALKDHEQALIEAIARLEVPSDGESDDEDNPFLHGDPMHRKLGWQPPASRMAGTAT